MVSVANCLCAHERVMFFFNKHHTYPQVSPQTIRHYSAYTTSKIFTHRHRVSLALFTFWWRHNWLCNAGDEVTIDLWRVQVISNSLNTHFILGDSHDRWCKNYVIEYPNAVVISENNPYYCINYKREYSNLCISTPVFPELKQNTGLMWALTSNAGMLQLRRDIIF